ncbi:hypothetical protein Leryth_022438 [Lithospermum erythrorhizon]|nr:hypothetical protein Leryth_022438 [Lithospermum erythrorhizon]
MLFIEQSKKLSFKKCISDGDLVIVYERHDNMKAIKVSENGVLQNRFGAFKHVDWIGKPFGSKVFSHKGGFIYLLSNYGLLAPKPPNSDFVLLPILALFGSLTTSLARAVAPSGHVYTFDFHEQRAASAREDFEKTGLNNLITVGVRDIQGEGILDEFFGKADSVF